MTTPPTPALTLAELSALPCAAFREQLDGIFEHSPWVAEGAWRLRPFPSLDALHEALLATLAHANHDAQLALIRAHPELAGREAAQGALTAHSAQEQRGAGLDQCSPADIIRLHRLNAAYRERFGFPFVIAVKGLSRAQIMHAIEARLNHDRDTEFSRCLAEIGKIARFRLEERFQTNRRPA